MPLSRGVPGQEADYMKQVENSTGGGCTESEHSFAEFGCARTAIL